MQRPGIAALLGAAFLLAGCSEFSTGDRIWLRIDCAGCLDPGDATGREGYVRGSYVEPAGDGRATVLVEAFELPTRPPPGIDADAIAVGAEVDLPLEPLAPLADQQAAFERRRALREQAVRLVGSFEYDVHDKVVELAEALEAAGARDYGRWLRASTALRRTWHRDQWAQACFGEQRRQGPVLPRCYVPDALWGDSLEALRGVEGSEAAFARMREVFDPITGAPAADGGDPMGGGYATLAQVGVAQPFYQYCAGDISAMQSLGVITRREIRTIRERCMRITTSNGERLPDQRTFAQLVTASTDHFVGFSRLE